MAEPVHVFPTIGVNEPGGSAGPEQVLAGIVRWWIVILPCAIVSSAGLAFWASTEPIVYEATVRVMVVDPGSAGASPVAVSSYRALVANDSLGDRVVAQLKLDRAPYRLSGPAFVRAALSVEEIRNTSLLQVRVRLPDAAMAAQAANAMSQAAADMSRDLGQSEAAGYRAQIKEQLDAIRQRFETAGRDLLEYRTSAQVELLKTDAEGMLLLRAGAIQLPLLIAAERAKLAKAEEELAAQQRLLTVRKSIDDDPAMMEALRPAAGRDVLKFQVQNEVVNPVHAVLQEEVSKSRARVAELERQQQQMGRQRVEASSSPMLTAIYAREIELARRQGEFDLAKRLYEDASARYEAARIQVAGTRAQLQVVDRAVPPGRPLERSLGVWAALGFVGGLLASVLGVVFAIGARPHKLLRARLASR